VKNKQIYNNRSYSPIRITEDGDIELVLLKYAENIPISELQLLNNCNVLSDTVPRDTNFFYSLWFSDPQTGKLFFSETGFGELKDKKGRTFLQREYIFTEFHPEFNTEPLPPRNQLNPLPDFVKNGIISTNIPEEYYHLLIEEHSVVCSIDKFTPTIVPLEEATLLGRLDGRIQSIDKDELKFILGDNVKIAVEESTSPLKLKTDELSVDGKNSIIMTDQIQLRPMRSRPKRFSVGSLYYNRGKKTFEFHDGKKWRTLVTE
tara:strand:+ start:53 stop:835 length:783 start_codon:yes stop_codon:yes gene_type:complete